MSIKRVTTLAIDDSQVTTAKLADGAITTAKITDGSISTAKIAAGAVDAAKISDNAVTVGKIADGAVSLSKLAAESVNATKIADGAVTPAKLSTGGPSWSSGTTTLQQGLELGGDITASGDSYIDFHSVFPANDYDARIIKESGANSDLFIINNGTGRIRLGSAGGVLFGTATMFTPTGIAPIYGARAWVNFNGTGTVAIRSSGNVSSITDGGTGVYTVNFTTAMPDTNYSVNVTARRIDANNANFSATLKGTTSANTNYPLSTTSCEVICGTPSNNAFVDSDVVCVSVFR